MFSWGFLVNFQQFGLMKNVDGYKLGLHVINGSYCAWNKNPKR